MAKIEDCPGFETFGADVKAARKAKQLSRSALADMIHCDSRYLANIENEGTLPSLPVVIQLIKICFISSLPLLFADSITGKCPRNVTADGFFKKGFLPYYRIAHFTIQCSNYEQ